MLALENSIHREIVKEIKLKLLASQDLIPLAQIGIPFDPNIHTIIQTYPNEMAAPGTITKIFSQGYRQNGAQLVRLAQVAISAGNRHS